MFRFGDPGGRIYTSAGTAGVNLLGYWTSVVPSSSAFGTSANQISVSAGNGRNSGSSLRFTNQAFPQLTLSKTLDSQATWGFAFGMKTSLLPTSNNLRICTLLDSGTLQAELRLLIDGTLQVSRNGTTLGTSTRSILTNTYNHFEWKTLIHPSAGTSELRVNGVAWIGPLTGLNTRNTANSTANQISFGDVVGQLIGTTPVIDFDDIIIWDGQSTDANGFTDISNFIGDCALVWLLPTGAGTTTQFTPDSGSNYARVNEATPDTTSYVADSSVGDIDTYAMANLGGTAVTVKSIASIHYASKDVSGSKGIKAELRSAGANTAHTTEISLGTSYQYYFNNWGQNPNNGSAIDWTPTTVNSLEAGQKISS